MKRNEAVLNYFGSKVSCAHHYPEPRYPLIIEPFAGGAGYSLLHRSPGIESVLCDLSPHVARAWAYVIQATPEEILALPLIEPDQNVRDLGLDPGALDLVRFSIQCGSVGPKNRLSKMARASPNTCKAWGEKRRARTARIASEVKHWTAVCASYLDLPNTEATWFIDPPYFDAGKNYHFGSSGIDYSELADWCRSRRGQVIVCENEGADWLPFESLIVGKPGIMQDDGASRRRTESVWIQQG